MEKTQQKHLQEASRAERQNEKRKQRVCMNFCGLKKVALK
jgi:hypothetical protein